MAEIHDADAADVAAHRAELGTLHRPEIRQGNATPWGQAQVSRQYADGIVTHSTAGHGGFHLDGTRNAVVHPAYRNACAWYEEDCEWAKVAHAFPALFTAYERRCADQTLRDFFPDAYEQVMGVILAQGQSLTRDRQVFAQRHRADWVVIAAIHSDQRPGFVECIAAPGGVRGGSDERRFLVPSCDYSASRTSFVIDPRCHESYEGPSSFATWTTRP